MIPGITSLSMTPTPPLARTPIQDQEANAQRLLELRRKLMADKEEKRKRLTPSLATGEPANEIRARSSPTTNIKATSVTEHHESRLPLDALDDLLAEGRAAAEANDENRRFRKSSPTMRTPHEKGKESLASAKPAHEKLHSTTTLLSADPTHEGISMGRSNNFDTIPAPNSRQDRESVVKNVHHEEPSQGSKINTRGLISSVDGGLGIVPTVARSTPKPTHTPNVFLGKPLKELHESQLQTDPIETVRAKNKTADSHDPFQSARVEMSDHQKRDSSLPANENSGAETVASILQNDESDGNNAIRGIRSADALVRLNTNDREPPTHIFDPSFVEQPPRNIAASYSNYFNDLDDWLELTGYHDLAFRKRKLQRVRDIQDLEERRALIEQEELRDYENTGYIRGPQLLRPIQGNLSGREIGPLMPMPPPPRPEVNSELTALSSSKNDTDNEQLGNTQSLASNHKRPASPQAVSNSQRPEKIARVESTAEKTKRSPEKETVQPSAKKKEVLKPSQRYILVPVRELLLT